MGPIPGTRAEAVAAELRRLILSGELPPATKLRQVEISERFGVSTTPVREAFATLAREGLVRQDAHRGVEVFLPSQAELEENYEIRLKLEPMATARAAAAIGPAQLDELEALAERMSATSEDAQRAQINREFHALIYASAQRPQLAELIENLRNSASVYLKLLGSHHSDDYRRQVEAEHREIVAQLRARAADRAAEAMERHLRHNLERIAEVLAEVTGAERAPEGDAPA